MVEESEKMKRAMEQITQIASDSGLVFIGSFAEMTPKGVYTRMRVSSPDQSPDSTMMLWDCLSQLDGVKQRMKQDLVNKMARDKAKKGAS